MSIYWGQSIVAPLWSLSWLQVEAGAPAAKQAPGLLQIIFSGGPIVIAIMLAIIGTSLLAAYLVFDHLLSLRRSELLPEGLSDLVRQALIGGDLAAARKACEDRPSLLSFVLMHGLGELEFGWSAVAKAVEEALAEQAARLQRKVEYLSVIGNIAPMLGLLGTVVGMVLAFREVASTQGMASAPQLAEGIYQALVTTIGGLVIAIPAISAYAIFRNRIDQYIAEAAYQAQHVFAPLRKRLKARSESK
ncbi:MAG: MotA/TolQ/ExbB proton channel family protein [Planctomycetota bacterium]